MADILVTSPFKPFTLPTQFKAVFNGFIYCGTVDAVDPSVSQVQVYLVNEAGDKVPVAQPLRTNAGGYLVYNGQPAKFITNANHSLLVRDSMNIQVWYAPDMSTIDPETAIEIVLTPPTVANVATGIYPIGMSVNVIDRGFGRFTIVAGGTPDGLGILDAGNGNTAVYDWTQPTAGDPRHFGGKANDDAFDSTSAVKYAANNLSLYFDGVYTITDEVVIKTKCAIRSVGKSGVKVKTGSSMTGKAAIRASYLPIGTDPNMADVSNQVRGISQTGQLYINANNTADYGFYGRGIAAESELDFIVADNAKICGIAYLTSWFSSIKTGFFGLNSGVNIAIGSPLSGEAGDIFVNGYNFPLLASYNTKVPTGTVYNQDGTAAEQKAAAGIILGIGFANRVGTLVSQAAQGANLVFSKMIGFSFGSIYVENGSRYTPARRTGILVASDNADSSTAPIDYIHLEANQQIMSRTATLLLDINTLYRYDNVKAFDSASAPLSMRVKNPSFYVRNAYGNVPPAALSYDRAEQEVHATGPADSATAAASRLSTKWLYRSGSHILRVKLSAVTATPVTVLLSTNTTNETFNVTDSLDIGLSSNRTEGVWYTIGIASPTSDPGVKATVAVYRQVTAWSGI